ncbi:GntR family transcriptional regulator [Thioclava dalianensis]|uniref:GntR family transcriptional regulator n=1 Tax=Thioclava dalianensis TaxID=1185766 RepID=A0A074TQ88_9RHOB|nr:GntR family transcriptional regulator [Thioclava dalianensis]KEP71168.1 GntR family transcriptional regulator [Thioclava dalianensis]SFN23540.1 DNA-binding transcriptional regulator, GntR family [Thioclava dalianensis]
MAREETPKPQQAAAAQAVAGHVSSLAATQLDLTRPVGAQIFQTLKTAILRMELPPGCILSETEVASRFGASRTPVREAMAQLRDAGLVTTLPSRGNFVTLLNEGKIREAQFLREALELANVAALAANGPSPASQAEITATLKAQARALERGDDLAFQAEDDAFHLALARATGFARAARVLEHEKMQLDRLRVLSLRDHPHLYDLLSEHQAIADAIQARDVAGAVTAAKTHLRSVLAVLSTLVARNSDYFD